MIKKIGVEMFRKLLNRGEAGDNLGALLRGIKREDIRRGQVLCKPGSCTTHTRYNFFSLLFFSFSPFLSNLHFTRFEGETYILDASEGGRSKPFHTGYCPQFFIRTANVTGDVELPEGVAACLPGDKVLHFIYLFIFVVGNVFNDFYS